MMKRDLKALIQQMTLEEKAGLCSGLDFWHTKAVDRLGIPSVMALMDSVSRMKKEIISALTKVLKLSAFHRRYCLPVLSTEN